jgi:hypothetical protein
MAFDLVVYPAVIKLSNQIINDYHQLAIDTTEDVANASVFCCCSGILSRHWSNWEILATTMDARNSRKISR